MCFFSPRDVDYKALRNNLHLEKPINKTKILMSFSHKLTIHR